MHFTVAFFNISNREAVADVDEDNYNVFKGSRSQNYARIKNIVL